MRVLCSDWCVLTWAARGRRALAENAAVRGMELLPAGLSMLACVLLCGLVLCLVGMCAFSIIDLALTVFL